MFLLLGPLLIIKPQLHSPRSFAHIFDGAMRWPVDLGDEWSFLFFKKSRHAVLRGHEIPGKCGERRRPHQNEETATMVHDSRGLIGFIANPSIMSQNEPSLLGNNRQPFFIRSGWREVIAMNFDEDACVVKNGRELITQVPISEENGIHAAFSKSTAAWSSSMVIS